MSTTDPTLDPTPDPTPQGAQVPTPATDPTPATGPAQDPTDWKAEARKWEQRAKADAGAAAKLAEIEESAKTEAQKQAEALAAAEAKVKDYEQREQIATWKTGVSAETGVPAIALAGSTEEEIKAHAETLKALITAKPAGPTSSALNRVNQADAPLPATTPGTGTLRAAYANQT